MHRMMYRFLRWCPGALGLWLRQKLFPRLFRSCGKGVLFGRFVTLHAPEKISLGNRVVLNNDVVLDADAFAAAGSGITLGDDVFIGTATLLAAGEKGAITVEQGANFSSFCSLRADAAMTVGRNCLVAAYCELGSMPSDRTNRQVDAAAAQEGKAEIRVEEGCWLGVRMRIAPGVTVGHDAIVGAHAVVTMDMPPFAVAVGAPAAVIRDRRTT